MRDNLVKVITDIIEANKANSKAEFTITPTENTAQLPSTLQLN